MPAGTLRRLRSHQAATNGGLTGRLRRALFNGAVLRLIGAVLGGLALYSAFAPSTWWWLAIVGFALLGLAVDGRSWRAGLGLGFVFGLTFYLPLLSFTNVYVGDLPWYALSVAEALLTAPVGALIAAASRRLPLWPVWAAAAWITGEACAPGSRSAASRGAASPSPSPTVRCCRRPPSWSARPGWPS